NSGEFDDGPRALLVRRGLRYAAFRHARFAAPEQSLTEKRSMDSWMAVSVLSRWLHVGSAIVLLGGSVYLRYVLMPAAADLPEAEHQRLQQRLMGRWRKFVMAGIGLLLLSGGYNYVAVAIPTHKGQGGYHAFLGTKILLALVVFFLA